MRGGETETGQGKVEERKVSGRGGEYARSVEGDGGRERKDSGRENRGKKLAEGT